MRYYLPKFLSVLAACAALTLLPPALADGAKVSAPWNITADTLKYDDNANAYTGSGNVHVWRGGYDLVADNAGFDRKTNSLWAHGNVVLKAGGDVITGDRVFMDLTTETGKIENGTLFIKANHFYIRGSHIEKLGLQSYMVKDACLTTCDGEKPDWKITSSKVKVTVGGYGTAQNVVFHVRKMPLAYTPFFVFPAKTKRQSGLLPPRISQSTRHGWAINQPFYLKLGESADATIYEHYMDLRGNHIGAELRYVFSNESKGAAFGGFLNDKKIDDGRNGNSDKWGYTHDAWLRPHDKRYWLAAKHNHQWDNGFKLRLDLDFVSDQDYLREFKEGYAGFGAVNSYFADNFGRGLDDYDETVRKNSLHLQKGWDSYSANINAKWYDDVVVRRWDLPDTTLQTLPFAGFSGARKSLFGSFASFGFDTGYAHFYREDGVGGSRADLCPRFYLPFDFGKYLNTETSVGLRETLWQVDTWEGEPGREKRHFSRETYDLRVDLSSTLDRVFSVKAGSVDKIRHSVTPMLTYAYAPDVSQDQYPFFDHVDRVAARNLLTLSIGNSLLTRSRTRAREQDAVLYDYQTLCWFELAANYDLNQANEKDPDQWETPHRRQPFSPVSARLELTPAPWLSMESTVKWSPYDGNFVYNSQGLTIKGLGHELCCEYLDVFGASETVRGSVSLKISEKWGVYGRFDRDLEAAERVKNGGGVVYSAACWSVDMGYTDEPGELRYAIQITLRGLGSMGRSAGS